MNESTLCVDRVVKRKGTLQTRLCLRKMEHGLNLLCSQRLRSQYDCPGLISSASNA